jgi:hypothetical protein
VTESWSPSDWADYFLGSSPYSYYGDITHNIHSADYGDPHSPYPDLGVWGECNNCDSWKWSDENCDCRDQQGTS